MEDNPAVLGAWLLEAFTVETWGKVYAWRILNLNHPFEEGSPPRDHQIFGFHPTFPEVHLSKELGHVNVTKESTIIKPGLIFALVVTGTA